jgi:hypothetical protein
LSFGLLILVLILPAGAESLISPFDWLSKKNPPHFRPGYSLPPLTRFGWTLPFDLRVLLAEKWGYALEFGGYASRESVERAIHDDKSYEYRSLRLAAQNPDKYKLSLILSPKMPEESDGWIATDEQSNGRFQRIWSPAASDEALNLLVQERTKPLLSVVLVAKPAIILNAGEYGIGVIGHSLKYWKKDPRVDQARGKNAWFDYISMMKAKEQKYIRDAVLGLAGNSTTYVYYTDGGGTHTDRDWNWREWSYDYRYMRGIGTYPSDEYYFRHFNDGWTRRNLTQFWGKGDLLTQALNAKAREISAGQSFSYDWVSGGWERGDQGNDSNDAAVVDPSAGSFSDIRLYTGFLRCIYLAGTLGANAGYYAYPKGGFDSNFPENRPPHWLLQIAALSRVHALFSFLEPFVKNSDLVPGPNRHAWGPFPAYELPSENSALRILARRHKNYEAWIVIAWSTTTSEHQGRVEIPGRGTIDITGDGQGKIYLVQNAPLLEEISEASVEMITQRYPHLFRWPSQSY